MYAKDKFFETFYKNPANTNADPLVAYFHRLGHAVRRSVSSVPLRSSSAPFITDSQAVACVVAFVFLKFLVIHMIG